MRLSTGLQELDFFYQGYKSNEFTLIYGAPGTGKTTIAMMAALTQSKNKKKVIYLDSENGFSIERYKQLSESAEKSLEYLFILKPTSFEEQHKQIMNLSKTKISLIIIDTIGFHYRRALNENYKLANDMIINQLKKLKELTKENIPILIINQVYSKMDNTISPVGGELIKSHCKKIIKLENNKIRTLNLEKPEKKNIKFEIERGGVILSSD